MTVILPTVFNNINEANGLHIKAQKDNSVASSLCVPIWKQMIAFTRQYFRITESVYSQVDTDSFTEISVHLIHWKQIRILHNSVL